MIEELFNEMMIADNAGETFKAMFNDEMSKEDFIETFENEYMGEII